MEKEGSSLPVLPPPPPIIPLQVKEEKPDNPKHTILTRHGFGFGSSGRQTDHLKAALENSDEAYSWAFARNLVYGGEKSLYTLGALPHDRCERPSHGSPSELSKRSVSLALQGAVTENVHDALRGLDIILQQQEENRNITDVGDGVTAFRRFCSSSHLSRGCLFLNMDVTMDTILKPGPVINFLKACQNIQDEHITDWTKVVEMLKNVRVQKECMIIGLTGRPCNWQMFSLRLKNGDTKHDGEEETEIIVSEYFTRCRASEMTQSAYMPCLNVGKLERPNDLSLELGGLNLSFAMEHLQYVPLIKDTPTMILGMDVTHGPPSLSGVSSMAKGLGSQNWYLIWRCQTAAESLEAEMTKSFRLLADATMREGIIEHVMNLYGFRKVAGLRPHVRHFGSIGGASGSTCCFGGIGILSILGISSIAMTTKKVRQFSRMKREARRRFDDHGQKGFYNMLNACYGNVAFQSFLSFDALRLEIYSISGELGPITQALKDLLYGKENAPKEVLEDPADFFRVIRNTAIDSVPTVQDRPSKMFIELMTELENEHKNVSDLFGGLRESQLTFACKEKSAVKRKWQRLYYMDRLPGNGEMVTQAFHELFTYPTQVNKFCEKCQVMEDCEMNWNLVRGEEPRILILHVDFLEYTTQKWFTFEETMTLRNNMFERAADDAPEGGGEVQGGGEINEVAGGGEEEEEEEIEEEEEEVPEEEEGEEEIEEEEVAVADYQLNAVIVVDGKLTPKRHFRAFVRRTNEEWNGAKWFETNDNVVRESSLEEVLALRQPEYLLYELKTQQQVH